jgi:adenylosuccinate lyase
MIPRYSRPDMVAIWSPESKFRIWFEIEAHACDAQAELGVIPKEAAKTIWDKGGSATFDIERIDEIERETKHDVIAFLTHLAEIVGPDARFVHQGMTSSDVLDTCLQRAAGRRPTCCSQTWTRCWPRSSAGPSSTRTPSASAAATASTPSRSPSA